MRDREDVDARGKVQWLYIWKAEVACLLIVRMAPGDYLHIHGSTPLASRILNGSSSGDKESDDPDGE